MNDFDLVNAPIDIHTSPAYYHDNICIEIVNKKKFCNQGEIVSCIEKGIIQESDLHVMHTLFIFQFMTRHTLTENIVYDNTIPDNAKKKDYKSCLAKLTKLGFVIRYRVSWIENETDYSAPFIYALSRNAFDYIRKNYCHGISLRPIHLLSYPGNASATHILSTIIFNQFHTQLLKIHRNALSSYFINLNIKWKKEHCTIRGLYFLQTEALAKRIALVVMVVRSNPEWKEQLFQEICCCERYTEKETALFHDPVYILLCENGDHSRTVNAFLKKHGNKSIQNSPVLYVIDQSLLTGDLLGKLYLIEEGNNGNYQFLLQKLNISI